MNFVMVRQFLYLEKNYKRPVYTYAYKAYRYNGISFFLFLLFQKFTFLMVSKKIWS